MTTEYETAVRINIHIYDFPTKGPCKRLEQCL